MSEEPNPYAAPSSPIESTQPEGHRKGHRPSSLAPFVYLVGWSWPIILGLCGVAADRVRISTPNKIALSIASLLLPALIMRFGGRWRWGCALFLGVYCLLSVMVMWFWN
jgi:hypothetical protein